MRGQVHALAILLAFVLSGCGTLRERSAAERAGGALSTAEDNQAEALARYSQGLIFEEASPASDAALRQFGMAVRLDPEDESLALRVAVGYLAKKDYPQAIATLEAARRHHPDVAQIDLLLGLSEQADGHNRQAARDFERAIRLEPTESDGYVRLASLYLNWDKPAEALRVLDRALAKVAEPGEILQFLDSLGRLYALNSQDKDAIPCFERVLRHVPDNPAVQVLLAHSYAAAGEKAKAIALLLTLTAARPKDGEALYSLGELYEETGDLRKAAEYFSRSAHIAPPRPAPYLRLAYVYLRTDPEKARATLQEALRALPNDPTMHTYLGLMCSYTGQDKEAVTEFAAAEKLALATPAGDKALVPMFYYWFGSAYERLGDTAHAEEMMARCIELHPDTHEALNYLAYMWAEKGIHLDQALAYSVKALKLEPEDGAYIDTLGWIYYRSGRFAEALQELRKAQKLMPDDPTVAEHLGDALQRMNQPAAAVGFWKRSFRTEPQNAALTEKLRQAGVDVEALRREAQAGKKSPAAGAPHPGK